MSDIAILIAALLLVFVYALLARRLTVLARPFREEMIDVAERLLSSKALNEKQRDMVCFLLDRSFSAADAWGVALLVVPAAAATLFYSDGETEDNDLPKAVRHDWTEFLFLSMVSNLMLSPGALVLFAMQMVPILLTRVSMTRLARRLTRYLAAFPGATRHRHAAS
ncbi:MAG: hypothetical protein EOS82_03590 [Mesorhizobium sp.]|uniref:hypothetical protein n=1 Tax=Mesorhizobium sp. TaxID=1871066 RepID=UPI000FE904FE|nr:hypothetical protein [Mesorhizobium sp.]RWQ56585.1 MAG: hypothetical protein EOS82_03590 [Mesorhizobium sp.]